MKKTLTALFVAGLLVGLAFAQAPNISPSTSGGDLPLDIYFIDTEGGQATLFVSPSGSMLVDAGFAGNPDTAPAGINAPNQPQVGRDAGRILQVLQQAKVGVL